jgi:Ca2+-binding EF-hand superfamily protein
MSKTKQQQKQLEPIQEEQNVRARVTFNPEIYHEEEQLLFDSNKLSSLFQAKDAQKKGRITQDLVELILKSFDKYTDSEMESIRNSFKSVTENLEEKTVDMNQFLEMVNSIYKLRKLEIDCNEINEAFKVFDRDSNGMISLDEMKSILLNFSKKFSEEEIEEIFNEVDINRDGNIDYQEFIEFYKLNLA